MAEVRPLNALHYNLAAVPALADVVAPPYDVIDAARRAELLTRSPFNVVEVDLPQAPGGRRSVRARRRDARGVETAGHSQRRPRAGALGPDPGVRRPRRHSRDPARPPLPSPGDALRPGARAPARAHPAGAEAGPPPPHRGDPPQHVADLLAARGGCLAPRRGLHPRRAVGRGDRRRGHNTPHLADRRRGRPPRGSRRAGRVGVADRRRPSPLRDGAHVRRRDRRRRPAPLHADGARLARRPRADRVRVSPSALQPRRPDGPGGPSRRDPRALRGHGGGRSTSSTRPATRASASSATSTPTTARPTACGSRTRPCSTRDPRRLGGLSRARRGDPRGADAARRARHERRGHRGEARDRLHGVDRRERSRRSTTASTPPS